MILVIAGTNRPGSNTRKVASVVEASLVRQGEKEVRLLDLAELPSALFDPSSYAAKPASFEPFQKMIFEARGIVWVVPEYNGSFPGVLKYFIDMLKFPESLVGVPSAFVGLAAGQWGALRAVEQLEMVLGYRSVHIYGQRLFLAQINQHPIENGVFSDATLQQRLEKLTGGFTDFCRKVKP